MLVIILLLKHSSYFKYSTTHFLIKKMVGANCNWSVWFGFQYTNTDRKCDPYSVSRDNSTSECTLGSLMRITTWTSRRSPHLLCNVGIIWHIHQCSEWLKHFLTLNTTIYYAKSSAQAHASTLILADVIDRANYVGTKLLPEQALLCYRVLSYFFMCPYNICNNYSWWSATVQDFVTEIHPCAFILKMIDKLASGMDSSFWNYWRNAPLSYSRTS